MSMESAFTLAPLCRLAWRMVVQMLPGTAYGGRVVVVGDCCGWGLVSVEFIYNVDVGVLDGGNRGGGGCSCNGSAELVGVSSALGSLVVASRGLGCVL